MGVLFAAAWAARGEAKTSPPEHVVSGIVEAGAGYATLSAGQPSWNDQYVRGSIQMTPSGRLSVEVSRQDHFGSRGTFVGAGYARVFDASWYGALSAGASDGGIFLPRLRLDGSLSRKWLEQKQLVTTLGLSYYRSKEVYFDVALLAGVTYYFEAPWIVEVGVRLNDSNPGHVRSMRAFGALTYGRNKRHFITLRYEAGREAYQVLAVDNVLSDFSSAEESVIGRQWITGAIGLSLRATHYHNPSYARWGVELGVFLDF